MSQSGQSTVTKSNALIENDNSDIAAVAEDIVWNEDESVRAALTLRTDASLGTGARDPGAKEANPAMFTGREQDADNLSGIVNWPQPRAQVPAATLHALQEWEGYVLEIGKTDFVANLVDLTAGSSNETEEAAIPLAEISDDDTAKIRAGSVFRWVIGYERSVAGTKKRVSLIVFRDLPAITKTDLRDGKAWARETIRLLNP